jgi:hypothetical protein
MSEVASFFEPFLYLMNYQRIYDQLVDKARTENRRKTKRGAKYESHHILPVCLGGTGKTTEWKNHPNIILFTPREHIIAHMLLYAIHPKNQKLMYSLKMMIETRKDVRVSSRLMAEMREKFSESMRGEKNPNFGKDMTGTNNPMYGKTRPDLKLDSNPVKNPIVRKKISDAHKGMSKPWIHGDKNPMHRPEVKQWFKDNNPNKRLEVQEKIRKALTGRKRPEFTGGKHPNAIPVMYEGIRYESQADLARYLGVACPKIIMMIKQGKVTKLNN